MDKLIKASLIASTVTIGGNMEQELLIKLDWNKIEKDFCMTDNEYREATGGYSSGDVYYISNWNFGKFGEYIDGLIVDAGGIEGNRRSYTYNDNWGSDLRDDLFTRKGSVYFLRKEHKDRFEATVNKMLSGDLSKLKDKKSAVDDSNDNKEDSNKDDSYDKGRGCWCF